MLISRTDFVGRINLSSNIKDEDINICINNVQLYEFKPIIDENLYNALSALTSGSSASELKTLWTDYVKPLLVFAFAKEFIIIHGKNFTQFGIMKSVDDTSTPLTDSERMELLSPYERNYNICLSNFKNKLESAKYTFDSVVYLKGSIIETIQPRSIIRAIKTD